MNPVKFVSFVAAGLSLALTASAAYAPTSTGNAAPPASPHAETAPAGNSTAAITARAADAKPKTEPPKTGSFELTFTKRSVLSEMKSLVKTLKVEGATTDYDLSKMTFLVYVPEKYDPKKPMGLLVLINYKPSSELPTPVLPQLAAANMAFIVAKDLPDDWWQRAGMAIDAADNMGKLYKIDANRVYVFGGGGDLLVSEYVGLNFPQVFTGTFTLGIQNYRTVANPDKQYGPWTAKMPRPDPTALNLAKNHPLVVAVTEPAAEWKTFAADFTKDGFQHVKYMTVTIDQYHYPNYTTDWLPDVLKFMDGK